MAPEPSDEELVRRCLEEDPRAWQQLVRRYARLVYALALRSGLGAEDAADVFQNVFTAAYRNLHVLEHPASLSFWLARITRREAWQTRRRATRRPDAPSAAEPWLEGSREPAAEDALPDEELERVERAFVVRRGLEALDSRCRRLLELLFFERPEASYHEAARALGMPIGSVGPTRIRCLEKLRRILRRLGL